MFRENDQTRPREQTLITADILVLTNLAIEHEAAMCVFEEASTSCEKVAISGFELEAFKIPSRTGGVHDVLLGLLPSVANTTAASFAALITGEITNLDTILSIGIAGAIPTPFEPEHHVRLGDLVATGPEGTVQFDFKALKESSDAGGAPSITPRHPPRPPSPFFLSAALKFQSISERERADWYQTLDSFLEKLGSRFTRPEQKHDQLLFAGHVIPHPSDPLRVPMRPSLFVGTIGSSNTLLKDSSTRDALAKKFKVKAVEMESSGVAEVAWQRQVGFYSVRGMVDYCNLQKNDVWHPYSSATAAVMAVTLISHIPASEPNRDLKNISLYQSLDHSLGQSPAAGTNLNLLTRENFLDGTLIEHPMHSQALDQINSGGRLAVVGPMGSGKSIFVRALAVSLESHGRRCFFLPAELVTNELLSHLLTEIDSLPPQVVLVLEDVHRDPVKYNTLYNKADSRDLALIVSTRPSFYTEVHRHTPLQVLAVFDPGNDPIVLSAKQLADSIVKRWVSENCENEYLKGQLQDSSLNAVKQNLWCLSLLLQHSNPGEPFDITAVHGSIADLITDSLPTKGSLSAYLAICLLFQHEITVPSALLGEVFGCSRADIDILLHSGLVSYSGATRSFFVPHAVHAQISLEALDTCRNHEILSIGKSNDDRTALALKSHFLINPAELPKVIRLIRNEPILLGILADQEWFKQSLKEQFSDVLLETWTLAHLLSDLTRVTNDDTRGAVVACLDLNAIVQRIDCEHDLDAVAALLDAFPWSVSRSAKSLVDEVNLEMSTTSKGLGSELKKDRVGFCSWMVKSDGRIPGKSEVSDVFSRYSTGKKLSVDRYSDDRIGFCSKSSETGDVIMCGKSMVSRPHVKSIEIVRALDLDVLSAKLRSTSLLYTVAHVVDLLCWIDFSVAREVVVQLDLGKMKLEVDKDDPVSELLKRRLTALLPEKFGI